MKLLIWGTGKRGKELKRISDEQGWEIKVFIDNDKSKLGVLDGISVVGPESIDNEMLKDGEHIWIATGAEEVYRQAKAITSNVFEWNFVEMVMKSQRKRATYPEIQLNDKNIRNCKLVKDRELLLKKFGTKSSNWKMAEIGVAFGDFSQKILKICKPKKLYLIDSWASKRYEEGIDCIFQKFEREISAGIVEVCRGYSIQKLEEFMNNELDWVYIDTVHDYETTKRELQICHQKVKTGGYICGHDYTKYNVYSRLDYGVYDAVNEFAVMYGYEFIYLTMEADGLQSFCLRRM